MSDRGSGSGSTVTRVRWAELLPDEFRDRRSLCPLAWLPLGLCEPHGHVAAYGLDTIKADWLCDEGARRFGGIVAPTQAWHVHETGYHARWLEDVIGEEPAEIGTIPPDVLLRGFLYQLRALANAGFRAAIVVSGHAGGNQHDLRRVAAVFANSFSLATEIFADPELVSGQFASDHAGKYEISQLLALRPDLVDLSLLTRGSEPRSGGRFALGDDADQANAAYGKQILEAQIESLGKSVGRLSVSFGTPAAHRISLAKTEEIWRGLLSGPPPFVTARPLPGQPSVSAHSQWKPEEYYQVLA